jgi:putative Holliday junction resolvase
MMNLPGRILAVDPGEKRLGLAISDPTQTIASPLGVIDGKSRVQNAEKILEVACEYQVVLIIIGQPKHWNGETSYQADQSNRLAEEIQRKGNISVRLWDEYGSTIAARKARRDMGVPRNKRSGHLDELAATIILQTYLESLIAG